MSRTTSVDNMVETLTALYQRNEMIWIGLSMFVLGLGIPETPLFWGIELSRRFTSVVVAS